MKTITYKSLDELKAKAQELNKDALETRTSHSFRVFEGGQTTELHIYSKVQIQ